MSALFFYFIAKEIEGWKALNHQGKELDETLCQVGTKCSSYVDSKNNSGDILAKELGEISLSDTDTFAYFFVYGQLGMLLNEGNKKDCDKRIGECLIEMLNL